MQQGTYTAKFNPLMGLQIASLAAGYSRWIPITNDVLSITNYESKSGEGESGNGGFDDIIAYDNNIYAKYLIVSRLKSDSVLPHVIQRKVLASFDGCTIKESISDSSSGSSSKKKECVITNRDGIIGLKYSIKTNSVSNKEIIEALQKGESIDVKPSKATVKYFEVDNDDERSRSIGGSSLFKIILASPKYVKNFTYVPPPPKIPSCSEDSVSRLPIADWIALTKVCDAEVSIVWEMYKVYTIRTIINNGGTIDSIDSIDDYISICKAKIMQYLPYLTTVGIMTPELRESVQTSIDSFRLCLSQESYDSDNDKWIQLVIQFPTLVKNISDESDGDELEETH